VYKKLTTVKYEGIKLHTSFLCLKQIEGNNISISKIPPDGTTIILSKAKKESSSSYFASLDRKIETEIPIDTKIVTLKDGSHIFIKVLKLRDLPQIAKLYGYIEKKSISFSFVGSIDSCNDFYGSLINIEFY
jgi:hypothetical protein